MKAALHPVFGRTITFSEIGTEGVLKPLDVPVTYLGDANVGDGVVLDRYVIPAIIDAVNTREQLRNKIFALETNLTFLQGRLRETLEIADAMRGMQASLEQMKTLCGETGISTESVTVV